MQLRKINNKKAAIQLSIGTIVIIVLAMSMLILGLVLVRNIFKGANEAVSGVSDGTIQQVNKLFAENKDKQAVIIPDSGTITLEQGSTGEGFAIFIRNVGSGSGTSNFGYKVKMIQNQDLITKCGRNEVPIDTWARIDTGRELSNIPLQVGEIMDDRRVITFTVDENAPICIFELRIDVTKGPSNDPYTTAFMNVNIVGN